MIDLSEDRKSIVIAGRLVIAKARQPLGAPWLDGGTVTLGTAEGGSIRFGALVFSPRPPAALAVGWRDALVPRPARWRMQLRRMVRR